MVVVVLPGVVLDVVVVVVLYVVVGVDMVMISITGEATVDAVFNGVALLLVGGIDKRSNNRILISSSGCVSGGGVSGVAGVAGGGVIVGGDLKMWRWCCW